MCHKTAAIFWNADPYHPSAENRAGDDPPELSPRFVMTRNPADRGLRRGSIHDCPPPLIERIACAGQVACARHHRDQCSSQFILRY